MGRNISEVVTTGYQEDDAIYIDQCSPGKFLLNSDGWLLDDNNNLICWIPPNFHSFLYMPGTAMIFGNRYAKLKIIPTVLGVGWLKCVT